MKEGTSNKDMSGTGGTDHITHETNFSTELNIGVKPQRKGKITQKKYGKKVNKQQPLDPYEVERRALKDTQIL
jgi:hypothetical protein